jgi:hypothetical protein
MLRKSVLLVFSIGVGIGIAELSARVWLWAFATEEQFGRYASLEEQAARAASRGQTPFKYLPHHYVGYIPAPNYARGKNRHNDLGFRGAPISNPKPEGEFRIVCLGGSTTYDSFVEDPAQSYPGLLESLLRKRGHESVRVINAGAEGYMTWESLITLEYRVLDLDPDMIIIYHAINDLLARIVWPPEAYRGDNSGALESPVGLYHPPRTLERSALLRILQVRYGRPSPSALNSTHIRFAPTFHGWAYVTQAMEGSYPRGIFETVGADEMLRKNQPVYFERNLRNMVAIARLWHVQPVFVTFAYSDRVDDPALNSPAVTGALEEMNGLIASLGKELDVPVFDFARLFPSDPELYVGAVHNTEAGTRLKAGMFADFLETSGLLPDWK